MHLICHHESVFNILLGTTDEFVWKHGVGIKEISEWIEKKDGKKGIDNLPERITRAISFGTSSYAPFSLKRVIEKLGPVNYSEIIEKFFTLSKEENDKQAKLLSMIPDPNDSWAEVELFRWQYGHLPGEEAEDDHRTVDIAIALNSMADALDGPTSGMPTPSNMASILRFIVKHGYPKS